MNLEQFFEEIEMMPEAVKEVRACSVSEESYQKYRALFWEDKEQFYEKVLQKADYRIRFLFYYSRMACEIYDRFIEQTGTGEKADREKAKCGWEGMSAFLEEKGMNGRKIFRDTFYDLTIWCRHCFSKYGVYGIDQYEWFYRHIEGKLFRLGRLQFEQEEERWNVHIPEGEKLELSAVENSFAQAFRLWGKEKPYVCHSWLLDPGLGEILPPDSRILQFQRLFEIVRTDFDEREAEERIYGKLEDNPDDYPENTSLQKNAKIHLREGKKLGRGTGILRI